MGARCSTVQVQCSARLEWLAGHLNNCIARVQVVLSAACLPARLPRAQAQSQVTIQMGGNSDEQM